MKYLLPALLLIGFLPTVATADVLPDNSHSVDSCLQIDNLADFQNYNFVATGIGHGGFLSSDTLSESKYCQGLYDGALLAIKIVDWHSVQYNPDQEQYGDWAQSSVNASLFIKSDLDVSLAEYVADTNPTASQTKIIHIDSVTDTAVKAHLVRTEITNQDGTTETILPTTAKATSTVAEEHGNPLPLIATVIAIMAVLAGVGGVFYAVKMSKKTWKKK
ncbi:MAG: hypothetical protein WCT24_00235 [Patescibacteria group bacterium]